MFNQQAQALSLFGQICSKLDSVQFKLTRFIMDNQRDARKVSEVAATKKLAEELNTASSKACSAYDNKNVELLKDVLAFIVAKTNA